ncbi:MAG: hypothetical protein QM658_14250 [Gordonia sp. (in: high G+C Gram-positive bacteria)]
MTTRTSDADLAAQARLPLPERIAALVDDVPPATDAQIDQIIDLVTLDQ